MKSLIITQDARGTKFTVSDEDRVWQLMSPGKLPPNFMEYDAIQEVLYVIKEAHSADAPGWVIERLNKYLQTIR